MTETSVTFMMTNLVEILKTYGRKLAHMSLCPWRNRITSSPDADEGTTKPSEGGDDVSIICEATECYICASSEGEIWRSACDCKERYIHPDCLLKYLQRRPDHPCRCPVCLKEFQNVTYKDVESIDICRCHKLSIFVLVFTALLTIFGCFTNTLLAYISSMRRDGSSSKILLGSTISLGTFWIIMFAFTVKFAHLQGGFRAIINSAFSYKRTELIVSQPGQRDIEMG